jgi:ribonuclease HI
MKTNTIDIYTDASIYNGHKYKKHFIGYAGVIMNHEGEEFVLDGFMHKRTLRNYFDLKCSPQAINIQHGEMVGIIKSLWQFRNSGENIRIFTDSQTAIDLFYKKAIKGCKHPKYKGLVTFFDKVVAKIEKSGGSVECFWIRGHSGCVGNTLADKYAKVHHELAIELTKNQLKQVKTQPPKDAEISAWLFERPNLSKDKIFGKEVNEFKAFQQSNYGTIEKEFLDTKKTVLSNILATLKKNVYFL